jgi:polyphosphate kinase
MPRNLDRRVEVMCRVRAPALRERLDQILELYLTDDLKAREILSDGSHRRVEPTKRISAQESLMRQALPAPPAPPTGAPW